MFWFLLTVLVVLILFLLMENDKDNFWRHIRAIPGPKALPLIGTEYHFPTSEEAYTRDRELGKKYFPIFKKYCFNMAAVCIMDPEDIELILKGTKHIEKSITYTILNDWLGVSLLYCNEKLWSKRRKLLTSAFRFNALDQYVHIFNKQTKYLVDVLKKDCHKPYINVSKPITEYSLYSIGESAFGKSFRDELNCIDYMRSVQTYGENFMYKMVRPWFILFPLLFRLTNRGRTHEQTLQILHEFPANLIKDREKFNDDKNVSNKILLLDTLMTKYHNPDIDKRAVKDDINGFIFAGHDTSAIALSHLLMVIANEKEIQEKIYEEMKEVLANGQDPMLSDLLKMTFTDRCIKECLRLYPSIPSISRTVSENVKTKNGYIIPKGCTVRIMICETHRNSTIWKNPDKFDPDRFLQENVAKRHPYSFLPFSIGKRNCLGHKYATLELKASLCGILRNFKLEPITTPADMKHKGDIVLRPACEIRVKFVPRN